MPVISVSQMLGSPYSRGMLRSALPNTRQHVTEINKSLSRKLVIAPSKWTKDRNRYSVMATACDYAVGALWARSSLDGVFARAGSVIAPRYGHLNELLGGMKKLVFFELFIDTDPEVLPADFLRCLGLLTHFDAMFRTDNAELPEWVLPARTWTEAELRRGLRENFPGEYVRELRRLYAAAAEDLPARARREYNPKFPFERGRISVHCDGDLLIGSLLLDLKVSISRRFLGSNVLQVLCYAALDALNGRRRIRSVGLYNPRYRALWTQPVDELVRALGGDSLESFSKWLADHLARFSRKIARGE